MFTTQTCSIFFENFNFKLDQIATEWDLDATLLELCFKNIIKGSKKKVPGRFFQNTCTLVLQTDTNKINIKLSRNGTVQLTGCKSKENAFFVFNWIWQKFKCFDVKVSIVWSMTNINLTLPFVATKNDIGAWLRKSPFPLIVINEPAYCYSGLFFKIPIDSEELGNQKICRIECKDGQYNKFDDLFINFVNQLPEAKIQKKLVRHYISFTIFSSGKCNVSGIGPELTIQKIDQVVSYLEQKFQ